jgi:hypothetical protein
LIGQRSLYKWKALHTSEGRQGYERLWTWLLGSQAEEQGFNIVRVFNLRTHDDGSPFTATPYGLLD